MDYERLASELMRALRGPRSQEAFARRLGVRSHAIYTWEAARNFPTASRALVTAARAGVDVRDALERFYTRPPAWLAEIDPTSPQGVARLLDDLRGTTSIVALARASGHSRFAIARWLKGEAQPRLPDFMRLIEAASFRLLDLLACLVDPTELPSVARAYRDLEATRRAAYDAPWSHAILRALELEAYRSLREHTPGWLAAQLGLGVEDEQRSLELLLRSGQIVRDPSGRYAPAHVTTVDTRRDPAAARRLRVFWSRVAAERIEAASDTQRVASAYNLFGVSHHDLERLRELQRAYFREMRTIIAQSAPVETVVLATMQMVELTSPSEPAGAPPPARGTRASATPQRVVGGVLMRGGEILLGKRSAAARSHQGSWDVVGGHCEEGESDEAALLRELREELGIEAVSYRSLGVFHDPPDEPEYRLHLYVVDGWRGTPTSCSPEHSALGWHDPARLDGLPLASPRYVEILGALVAPERAQHEAFARELDRDCTRD